MFILKFGHWFHRPGALISSVRASESDEHTIARSGVILIVFRQKSADATGGYCPMERKRTLRLKG